MKRNQKEIQEFIERSQAWLKESSHENRDKEITKGIQDGGDMFVKRRKERKHRNHEGR